MGSSKKIWPLWPLLAASAAFGAGNEIQADFAVWTDEEPVIDGKLDDAVWARAVVHDRWYEYFKPRPKVSPLKSELRLLYTDKALFLGITHYESAVGKLKVINLTRDSVDWYEDMDEIYLEPNPEVVGYTRFNVNSAGALGDVRRIDSSVWQNEWNGDGWDAKVVVGEDRWTVEMRVPYTDLEKSPVPGESLWRLCITRYQWTTGKFVGSVSSPRGSSKGDGFGYLFFLKPGEKGDADYLRRRLAGRVAPPWFLTTADTVLFDEGEGIGSVSLEEYLAGEEAARRAAAEWKRRLNEEFGGEEK